MRLEAPPIAEPVEVPKKTGFRELLATLRMRFGKLFAAQPKTKELPSDMSILPFCARKELEYGNRMLSIASVRTLLSGAWMDNGIYLALKSLRDDPAQEALLLEAIVREARSDEPMFSSAIVPYLDRLDSEKKVDAGKTNQISLYGPNIYRGWIDRVTEISAQKNEIPCLITHSGYLFLRSFLNRMENGTLITIDPRRIADSKMPAGFIISVSGKDSEIRTWDLSTDLKSGVSGPVTIIDDRIGKGVTSTLVEDAFARAPGRMPSISRRFMFDATKGTPILVHGG